MTREVHIPKIASLAVSEAILRLGLVKPEAFSLILTALPFFMEDHRHILTLRKSGDQLNTEEKAQLGLNARAFLSKELLYQLAPEGLRNPAAAHERTLQRASLTVGRAKVLYDARRGAFAMMAMRICPQSTVCPQSKDWTDVDVLGPLPPHDCGDVTHNTCRSVFVLRRQGRQSKVTNE